MTPKVMEGRAGVGLPWLEGVAARFQEVWRSGYAPQAMLVIGARGVGKKQFADWVARRWVCRQGYEGGIAPCGVCPPCRWSEEGHPDRFWITPAEEEGVISIEAVRTATERLRVAAHGERRAVVIAPAEGLSRYAANALLKVLEEPPPGVLFVLVSEHLGRLLPTVVSRAQRWRVGVPDRATAVRWLRGACPQKGVEMEGEKIEQALALVGGGPLAAQEVLARGWLPWVERFVRDAGERVWREPVSVAVEWGKRVREEENGISWRVLFDWFQRWVADVCAVALGPQEGEVSLFFPYATELLRAAAGHRPIQEWFSLWERWRAWAQWLYHPLNGTIQGEALWLGYAGVEQERKG
ncbi:MAG: hypothetical protein N2557_03690 [Hydrogenophilus sp.]|nr:hypothetical protein [Hydrogenophilus sp.]